MATKVLWDKGEKINEQMRECTAGTDPVVDKKLVCVDCIGSAAHARMLNKCGFLSNEELTPLLAALKSIYAAGEAGTFEITPAMEDVHTAIELKLTEVCGEAGERINTARSRSDQAALNMRLWLRGALLDSLQKLLTVLHAVDARYKNFHAVPMPGYTHYQPAMPSSVGMWLHSWYSWGVELVRCGLNDFALINQNPLGAGAGFGTSLTIDREYTASLLQFDRVQTSAIDVNNRRGWFEERYLRFLCDVSALFEKVASDIMLFTSREFQFFSLPLSLTTGSSIMPQKRNYDLVELLRGVSGRIRGALAEESFVISKLPSSYHRDLQYTKEPALRAQEDAARMFTMAQLLFDNLQVDDQKLRAALYDDLYATYHANRLVTQGVPFRTAYKETANLVKEKKINGGSLATDFKVMAQYTEQAMEQARVECGELERLIQERQKRVEEVVKEIFHA